LCDFLRRLDKFEETVDELEIRVFGKVAYACLISTMKTSASGHTAKVASRGTLIFVREENNWKIIHEHWSAADPVDMMNFLKQHQGIMETFQKKPYTSRNN
jgi:ketosteroid isomerase-like protein